jgi:diguanylate cyclase (GGDEF)-like protein/PAS domain S-box-containing protein
LYSNQMAAAEYVRFAILHGSFVLGYAAIQIVFWHFAERAQADADRIRMEADEILRRSGERFEALVQDSSDVIAVLDRTGTVISVSAAVERVMGYSPDSLVGTNYHALVHSDDVRRLRAAFVQEQVDHRRTEVRVLHADGSWRWHDMALRNLNDRPAVSGWVINHHDITERRDFQDKLEHDASHDALTGLANRGELLRTLQQELATVAVSGAAMAVLFLDLDGFKQVNDMYGHETGDILLVSTAESLLQCVVGADTVGRLGGDEFAVILTRIDGIDDAVAVAVRIIAALTQPIEINGHRITSGASIGIAIAEGDIGCDALLHQADTAMYHAKRDPNTNWRIYLDGLHDPDIPTATLGDEILGAIADDQLDLHYQPVVDLLTGELTGFEALVRWQHPVRGLLPPHDFIALAEQSGLIERIGDWVLHTACHQVELWQQRMTAGIRLSLSINLSPRQLDPPDSVERIIAVLHQTGFALDDLSLEITESAVVDAGAMVARLAELQRHGVRIALDDFGTGYSSLRYLSRLPVDILKIDRCFVAELDGTPAGSAVAEAVIRLGRILNLDTIAEGVETAAQAAELALLGCRGGQGYFFAHPLDARQVDALIGAGPVGRLPMLPRAISQATANTDPNA